MPILSLSVGVYSDRDCIGFVERDPRAAFANGDDNRETCSNEGIVR